MKKTIFFLAILGLFGSSLVFSFAEKAQETRATTILDAGSAWTYESTKANALYFKMAENSAPYNDWNVRYKPVTVDSLVIVKPNGTEKRLPEANLNAYEAICKFNSDSYYLEQWFFNDGTTGKLEIGDTVQFNGDFTNASYDTTIRISFSEFYICSQDSVLTFGKSNNAIKADFMNRYGELFEYELYYPEDLTTLRSIESTLSNSIDAATSMKDIYVAYNSAVSQASLIEKSPEGFHNYQESRKEEIRNYVSLDDYLDEQKAVVQGIIDDCCDAIDAATTTSEIKALIAQAKADIDAVLTRTQVIENKIINKESGYEQYLQSYDQVTLNDLSLGESIVFHGLKSERSGEINTNIMEGNLSNTFVPNPTNEKGNLIFNFTYNSTCQTNAGANLFINLRGVKYYGYKFGIGTDSQGMYFTRVFSDETTFVWGNSNYLTNSSQTYSISVGAIDLVEGNRTWIFITVNGVSVYSAMTDSHPVCTNPRVSLSNNDNEHGDRTGITTIGNYYPSDYEDKTSPIYGGIFKYEEGHSDITQNLYLNLDENALRFDVNKKLYSYSTNPNNIKLVRGSNEYALATSNIPIIAKYSETKYQLFLSSLLTGPITSLSNNDKLIISGNFVYFDENEGRKVAFEIAESIFVYTSSSWQQEISLNAYKQDTIRKVNQYLADDFLKDYDTEEQNSIKSLVNKCVSDINNSTNVETINNIYASFKSQISSILTSFRKYLESKVSSLTNYVSGKQSLYRPEDWTEITGIINSYSASIRNSSTTKEADALYKTAIKLIDSILTIEEHNIEDLKEAKYEAISEIKNHYGSFDLNSMSDDEVNALNLDTKNTISEIKNASSIDEVNSILNNYKSRHPLPQSNSDGNNKKKWYQCGGNVAVNSILLNILSLTGLGLLLYRKFKI